MKHPAPRFLTTLFLFSLCQVLPPTQAQTFATPPPSHTATQTHPLTTTPSGTPNLDSEEWAFLTLINNYRAQNGLSALQVDVDLENSAQWMSNDMASNNYFSHTDSLGRSPGARLAAFGYTYYPWGENLAAGFSDAQDAFNGWLNACDPDASGNCTYAHRANMLGSGYNAIGIARAYGAGSTYGWYWTTDFGGVVEQAINPPGSPTPTPTPTPTPSAPSIASFTASPATVAAGQTATLSWSTSGATSVTIDNGIGAVAASGSVTVTPSQTTTYTLTASNSSYFTTAKATVTVSAPTPTPPPTPTPSIASFNASPATVAAGQTATLSWSTSGATSVTIDNGIGAVAASGSVTVTPSQTTTYTLTASNSSYFTTAKATVTVSAPTPTPPPTPTPSIASFTASPATVAAGQTATLSWSTSGATSVTIDNGIGAVAASGSVTVTPSQTTTYTLTASNSSYFTTAKATVTVSAPTPTPPPTPTPSIASFNASPATVAAGQTATHSWSTSGATSVTIDNGVGAVAASGSVTVTPSQTTTYTLTASNSTYFTTAKATVTVSAGSTPQPSTCPAPASGAFTGCYYSNLTLSGNPVMVRTDPQINFNWGYAPPSRAIPAGPYSVQWQGNFTFAAGTYTFTATTSDGMRIYIDGNLVLDRWFDQPAYIYNVRSTLAAGVHLIVVQYYDNTGSGTAHLTWQNNTPATQPPSILSFTASPAAVAAGQKATLSWSVNGATDIAIDNGVGDVTGAASAAVQPGQTTTYTLTASNSAGSATAQVTVTVASQTDTQPPTAPVLTSAVARSATEVDLAWSAATDNVGVSGYRILRNGSVLASVSGSTLTYADQSAAANTTYTYAVVAFDGAGNTSAPSNPIQVTTPASAPTGGACPPPAAGTFTACYYSGTALSGNPVLTETDNQINFDWGAGSPAPSVPASNFSARWQGYFNFDSAVYSFVAQVSDGIRVYIDGQLLIDHWQDQPVTFYQARPAISQGSHLITVEYYAHSGWASCHLTWQER